MIIPEQKWILPLITFVVFLLFVPHDPDILQASIDFGKKSRQEDAITQNNFGVMYYEGREGLARNYKKAVKWYRKAAQLGLAVAQHNLGAMHYEGYGVGQSYDEAVMWYRKAAEQGLVAAQYNLSLMYYEGHGVAKDYKEAARLWRNASEQGLADAQKATEVICERTPEVCM